ncbi:MAG TPA: 30S ribosomal protein S15 [Actinomycetota bacterium]|nr:30S ribosomal protein S15 [Actinomycetota bacterium]
MSKGLEKDEKQSLIGDYRIHETDSGSPEVQIAMLTRRITLLTEHVKVHRKDFHTTLGLRKLVSKQRRLLGYLKREDFDRYKAVTDRLNIKRR